MWLDRLARVAGPLDHKGLDECFADGTFSPAKNGSCVGKTKRGTNLIVVADGQGVPLAIRAESTSPAEVTLQAALAVDVAEDALCQQAQDRSILSCLLVPGLKDF